jgi:hypothetical protein
MAISFKDALARLENKRVKSTRPLIPPQILQEDLPLYVSHTLQMYVDPHICVAPSLLRRLSLRDVWRQKISSMAMMIVL